MSIVKVKNPTAKTKAIRIAGGHHLIEPGKTSPKLEVDFRDGERERYEDAGLKFTDIEEEKTVEKGDDKKPAPPPAPTK